MPGNQPDTAAVRHFIKQHFNDDDFEALAFDFFPDVSGDFTGNMTFSRKIQLLLQYASRQPDHWQHLLEALEKMRPEPYRQKMVDLTAAQGTRAIDKSTSPASSAFSVENGNGGWLIVDDYLRIHFESQLVEVSGRASKLTSLEFRVFSYLANRPGVICSREELMKAGWPGMGTVSNGALSSLIYRIRRKIEPEPSKPKYVLLVRGIGYRFQKI